MSLPSRPLAPLRAVVLGSLAVGILDGAFAAGRAILNGNPVMRVGQGIAAALIGRSSYDGGAATALLGLGLHFVIATGVVVTFYLVSRRLTWLTDRPILWGAVYGVIVFFVMQFVVIPLSAISLPPRSFTQLLPGILIHVVAVGIPTAVIIARVGRDRPESSLP